MAARAVSTSCNSCNSSALQLGVGLSNIASAIAEPAFMPSKVLRSNADVIFFVKVASSAHVVGLEIFSDEPLLPLLPLPNNLANNAWTFAA